MTKEELLELEGRKILLRTMLSELSLSLKKLRSDIKDIEAQWEVFNNEYVRLDREIAFATKVRVITRKKPENHMTASQAQEMLALLGYSDLTPTNEEEEIENEPVSCDL